MSSVWKGSISFGLISIPIKASVAARAESISFNMLHTCGSRINQKTWCASCNKEISKADTVKGFDEGNGRFLRISADEIKACAPASSQVMEIAAVVDAGEVDPIWFEASYYLEPEEAGRKGYKLLADALKAEKKIAIAYLTLSQREHVVFIRPYAKGLMFHTMFYAAEVRAVPSASLVDIETVPQELALARQLLLVNAATFNARDYADGYQTRILALLETKRQGAPAPKAEPKKAAEPAMDLMAALAASLKAKKAA